MMLVLDSGAKKVALHQSLSQVKSTHTMKNIKAMKYFSRTVLALLMLVLALPAAAQNATPSEMDERFAAQFAETKEKLALTEEQAVAVEEIMKNTMTERLLIMDKYGIDFSDPNFKRPARSTLQKMGKEMERLEKDTNKQLDKHLDKKQMKKYKSMEKARKKDMRKRLFAAG